MNAIKKSLGDYSFSLDTHHLHYHAVYQAFTGKQLAAQLLRAVNSALLSAWGRQEQVLILLSAPSLSVQRII